MAVVIYDGLPKSFKSRRADMNGSAGLSFLYVFQCETHFKVGISRDPKRRLCDMQNSCPFPIKPVLHKRIRYEYALFFERTVHDELSEFKTKSEWFSAPLPRIIEAIEVAAAKTKSITSSGKGWSQRVAQNLPRLS
jgi:hypothetical protein